MWGRDLHDCIIYIYLIRLGGPGSEISCSVLTLTQTASVSLANPTIIHCAQNDAGISNSETD